MLLLHMRRIFVLYFLILSPPQTVTLVPTPLIQPLPTKSTQSSSVFFGNATVSPGVVLSWVCLPPALFECDWERLDKFAEGNVFHRFAATYRRDKREYLVPGVVCMLSSVSQNNNFNGNGNGNGTLPSIVEMGILYRQGGGKLIRENVNLKETSKRVSGIHLLPPGFLDHRQVFGDPMRPGVSRPHIHVEFLRFSTGIAIFDTCIPIDLRSDFVSTLSVAEKVNRATHNILYPPVSPDFSLNTCYRVFQDELVEKGESIDRFGEVLVIRVDDPGGCSGGEEMINQIASQIWSWSENNTGFVARIYGLYAKKHRGGGNTGGDNSARGESKYCRPTLLFPPDENDDTKFFCGVENGISFRLKFGAGSFSTGLYLDQRDLRCWLKNINIQISERKRISRANSNLKLLNLFAHASSFSVAASETFTSTNVDLSKKWLTLPFNLPSPPHKNVVGDAVEYLGRVSRTQEKFDCIIIDPPSTSTTRRGRRFSVKKDYVDLVAGSAKAIDASGGLLICVTNYRQMTQAEFETICIKGISRGGRKGRVKFWGSRGGDFAVTERKSDGGGVKTLVFEVDFLLV